MASVDGNNSASGASNNVGHGKIIPYDLSKMKSVPSSTVQIGTDHTTAPTSISVRNQNNLSTNLAVPTRNRVAKRDALQAVKLDPAVLEAQVTFDVTQANAQTRDSSKKHGHQAVVPKAKASSSKTASFEDFISGQQAALLSLLPHQFDLLMKYVDTLRRQRQANQTNLECAFCKNNGESVAWYSSHSLRSWRGRVLCPVLRSYRCRRCGATGDRAHTIKYCPENIYAD